MRYSWRRQKEGALMKHEHNTSTAVSQGPCECGSSDGKTLYTDGHTHCYVCATTLQPYAKKDNTSMVDTQKTSKLPDIDDTKVGPLTDRGIVVETVRHYKVRLRVKHGVVVEHYYPYTNSGGEIIAYKKRIVESKGFMTEGPINKSGLFGQSAFSANGKAVTICEGEIDTMAAYQMQGSRYPTVGVKSSSSAYKDAKQSFEFLDSFETIVICMDNDEPGQKAAKQIASLFPKKSKIMKLTLNDAGKYLEEGKHQDFVNLWWRAEKYKADDVISGADAAFAILKEPRSKAAFQYPWDVLNKFTYGIRTGEMVTLMAGSGSGKTAVSREIVYHILKNNPDVNIGLMFLEETGWETTTGLVALELSKPIHLPDVHTTKEELWQGTVNTWGTDRVHSLSESWKDNNVDYICDKIRYFAKGLDCKFIVLDHISFMVSDTNGDERKMLDEIAHKLKALTVELDIHLHMVVHCKRVSGKPLEEGGKLSLPDIRGTAGIGQLSNIVMGIERDGQNEDMRVRNTTLIRIVKNRFSGKTGPTSYVHYDEFTGRMTEIEKEETDE
jgi:twinkle protein